MKWRSTAVYLLVLLLLGGYFYYFEVVKKEQKETAEKESKRVFSFDPESVQALEIVDAGGQPLRLEREGGWKIVAPVQADVDKAAFDGFFSALRNLEAERRIGPAPDNLSSFGLDNPPLKVRILMGGDWTELWLGAKNPAGDLRYARLTANPGVFLVSEGNWGAFNKTAKDLRKKEIFSFRPEDVSSVQVAWKDGATVSVERQAGPGPKEWKRTDAPGFKIKTRKVENVIEQIQWMRALDFLPADLIFDPVRVTVKLGLADGRSVELQIGAEDKDTRQAPARSSDFGVPVRVSADILKDIPESAAALEDRSLISSRANDVREIRWQKDGSKGGVIKIDDKTWGVKEGDGAPKPFKDSFRTRALLWEIGDAEYEATVEPKPEASASFHAEVEIYGDGAKPASLAWDKLPPEGKGPGVLWIGTAEARTAVTLKYETLRKIEDTLDQLASAAQKKE
jgi:hypothetical protein